MSEAIAFLDQLRRSGVRLWVAGEELRFKAPEGTLTPELKGRLRQHKSELIEHLSIPRLPDAPHYAASHAQLRLWVLSQIDENASAAYNIPLRLLLEGPLDRAALADALGRLVARHEALRTTFALIDGALRQIVHPPAAPALRELDLSSASDPEAALHVDAEAEAAEPFDLEHGPLLRVCLARLGPARDALLLTLHHIVCDGWSLRVIMKDLRAFYESAAVGAPAPGPLPLQCRDFAAWQNRALASDAMRAQRDYWLEKLGGRLPVLDLPLDAPRPPAQSFRGGSIAVQLDAEESRALRDYARSRQTSVFAVLIALIKVLLHRYTGQTDLIVGIAVAGRDRPELADQVGCHLNTLALRDSVEGAADFDGTVRQVRQTWLDALDHQDYPFDSLLDGLRLPIDLSRSPLFDVMVISQSGAELSAAMGDVRVSHVPHGSLLSKFDLTFDCEEGGDFLTIGIEYNAGLFAAERIARMGGHLRTLLGSALRAPSTAVGALRLLPGEEWKNLMRLRNRTAVPVGRANVVERIAATARRVPGRIAVSGGKAALTFAELDAKTLAIAQALRTRGVGRGDIVGVLAARSPQLVAALLGVLRAGAAYLPLDATYPAERIAFMLEDSGARLVLTDAASRDALPQRTCPLFSLEDDLADAPDAEFEPPAPEELAYVIYTSGSTGRPKGVQIPHGALANFLESMEREPGLREGDALLAVTTVCFDIAALELFLPLCVGARLVLADRETAADGAALLRLLRGSGATALQATPATWRMLLAVGWGRTPGLRALCGGEALPRELAGELIARADEVWNLYGPTETTIWSAAHRVAADERRGTAAEPIGRPIANTQLYALDEWLSPVPAGVPGELFIGGNGIARGYLGRPALTAEKFLPDPFSGTPGARMYRTGDLVRAAADGTIEFLGRRDHQVKVRGFRIELGEIEACLRAHPEIADAAVVAQTDDGGDTVLAAGIVARHGREPSGIAEFLAARLPAYMAPAIFKVFDALPLTPNGKVDRRALIEALASARPESRAHRVAPRDETEAALAGIWQEVLGAPEVGVDDDFFELGGHSVKAAQVMALVEDRLGVRLTLLEIFRLRTVAKLAETIRTRHAPAAPEILPMTAEELELLND
jgi:amino acid adenylation domain-containing protein